MKVQVLKSQRGDQTPVFCIEGVFLSKRNASIEMKKLFGCMKEEFLSTCGESDLLETRISNENSRIAMSVWNASKANNADFYSIEIVEKEVKE